jgi:hypothetical protein
MGQSMQTALVLEALNQVLQRRQPKKTLQHHSDRGCQYTQAKSVSNNKRRETWHSVNEIMSCG